MFFCDGYGDAFSFPTVGIIGKAGVGIIEAGPIGCVFIGPAMGFWLGIYDNSLPLNLFNGRKPWPPERPCNVQLSGRPVRQSQRKTRRVEIRRVQSLTSRYELRDSLRGTGTLMVKGAEQAKPKPAHRVSGNPRP